MHIPPPYPASRPRRLRRDEFTRAKDGNLRDITRAIDSGQIECMYNASPKAVAALDRDDPPAPT